VLVRSKNQVLVVMCTAWQALHQAVPVQQLCARAARQLQLFPRRVWSTAQQAVAGQWMCL
jgi:hypothetical protein